MQTQDVATALDLTLKDHANVCILLEVARKLTVMDFVQLIKLCEAATRQERQAAIHAMSAEGFARIEQAFSRLITQD